jgi:hypothetical protein
VVSRDEADRALAVLGPAYDRIAAAMYGLDSHAGLQFLRGSGLTGTTGEIAEDVQALMTQLWSQFAALGQQLELAQDGGDLATVALDAEGLPLDGGGPAAQQVTLVELARRLESDTAELAGLLTEVDAAASTVAGRVAALTDALGELQAYSDVSGLAAELADVRGQALADPVEVARGGPVAERLHRFGVDLDAARARVAELARVREEHPRQLAALRDAIGQVAAAEAEATRSYAVVRAKIANPGLPAVPAGAGQLRDRLSDVERLGQAGQWGRLAEALAALARDTAQARDYANRLRSAADGLIDRRTELRGRLDAYRAKAARLGFGEHPELSERHREAYELLFTSPCDLPAATRAVFRYQQSLAGLIDRKETVT